MHELSLCQAIAETAERRAAGRPVQRVNVRIGHLRQVVPDSLTFAWELLVEDSPLAGSTLDVDYVPAVIACSACGEQSTLEWPVFVCLACGSHDVQLVSGEELLLVSLQLAERIGEGSSTPTMSVVTKPDWVVRRDGSAHEVLSDDGTWGTMETAKWFASQAEAAEAELPEGTTGTPIQMHPDAEE